jgi:hypothetical protein
MFGSLVCEALWGVLLVSPLHRLHVGAVRGLCTLTGYESMRVGDGVATSQFVALRWKLTFGLS